MSEYDFTFLSFGCGVQSTALLVLSALAERNVPEMDCAIFADTGDEPQYVYDYLEIMTKWAKGHGIEIQVCSAGKLSDTIKSGQTFVPIPVWRVGEDGRERPQRRQCTRSHKLHPIEQKVRELLGYKKGQRVKEKVRCLLGISMDEVTRVKPSRTPWVTNEWPLIDARLRRTNCVEIVTKAGLPHPQKSSCTFCPYHSNRYWHWLKTTHPADFQNAVDFDAEIRALHPEDPMFVHRSMIALDEVDLSTNQLSLWDEECEGYCGV